MEQSKQIIENIQRDIMQKQAVYLQTQQQFNQERQSQIQNLPHMFNRSSKLLSTGAAVPIQTTNSQVDSIMQKQMSSKNLQQSYPDYFDYTTPTEHMYSPMYNPPVYNTQLPPNPFIQNSYVYPQQNYGTGLGMMAPMGFAPVMSTPDYKEAFLNSPPIQPYQANHQMKQISKSAPSESNIYQTTNISSGNIPQFYMGISNKEEITLEDVFNHPILKTIQPELSEYFEELRKLKNYPDKTDSLIQKMRNRLRNLISTIDPVTALEVIDTITNMTSEILPDFSAFWKYYTGEIAMQDVLDTVYYESVAKLPESEFKEFIKNKILSSKQHVTGDKNASLSEEDLNKQVIMFNDKADICSRILENEDFQSYVERNIESINAGQLPKVEKSFGFELSLLRANLFGALHNVDVYDVKLDENGTPHVILVDIYDFNPQSDELNQLASRVLAGGLAEEYVIVIDVKIQKIMFNDNKAIKNMKEIPKKIIIDNINKYNKKLKTIFK